eukprot:CAMPEP_0119337748 /NCGR_PEP_ID=MMETSP1333-20130426/94630_1 /TAXON_ID=418940 /ORGANISM="Scyphosphaera apsteinii, Strain RCC1455" /LENGTH=143 /DNA_ID=CAMNT_0007348865 /DNA_START=199 /DNA_END=630 /DNA_ORIENTATION=-
MTAYRVVSAKRVLKAYDDDGEAHGGQRLAGCLVREKAVNCAVVVSRVWGGQNLGKRRFEHIVERARTLLLAAGHRPGEGIQHAWGVGQSLGSREVLGGAPLPPSKRARADMDEHVTKRSVLAIAAERRLLGAPSAACSTSASK